MINELLKQVQDNRKIKSKDLAQRLKISEKHISKFRTGKTNFSSDLLWQLIVAMEQISPGAMKDFGMLIARYQQEIAKNSSISESLVSKSSKLEANIDWQQLIADATPADMEEILLACAARWTQIKNQKPEKILSV
ncbi:MAG: helix-turn-helix transcriptional regulator [Prochloraceae cyanobacterium]|nr:helix-turn-helix transcriptional regulator [Prochloraceae cyanobacterium]